MPTIFFLISSLGLLQQLLHFIPQLLLLFLHPSVAHRLVLAGVGFHLRPIYGYPPHFHRSHFQRHLQDLLEQSLQCRDGDLAKVRDRSEVRLVARRQNLERDVFLQPLLDPARTEHPRCSTHTPITSSSAADRMAAALASLPRTSREWPTDPIDPPHRSRSTPDVLPPP